MNHGNTIAYDKTETIKSKDERLKKSPTQEKVGGVIGRNGPMPSVLLLGIALAGTQPEIRFLCVTQYGFRFLCRYINIQTGLRFFFL